MFRTFFPSCYDYLANSIVINKIRNYIRGISIFCFPSDMCNILNSQLLNFLLDFIVVMMEITLLLGKLDYIRTNLLLMTC